MIAILGGSPPPDAMRLDLSSWLALVIALAFTLGTIYYVAQRGRNAKTFRSALVPAAAGLLIAIVAAVAFLYYGRNTVRRSHLSRVEILGAPAIVGGEDVAVVAGASPRLLISATDRRKTASEADGQLLLLDPARRHLPAKPLVLEGRDGCSFRPHGIDVIQEGGETWVFVVNHHLARDTDPERGCQPAVHAPRKPMESIEIFKYQGPDQPLRFAERLMDPLLGHANDLAAVGRNQLFVTVPNSSLLEAWNAKRGRCTGRVVEWNRGVWGNRADDLCYPNGIAVQPATSPVPPPAASGPTISPAPGTATVVWVATSFDGALHRLPKLPRPVLIGGKGAPDNLSWAGGDLLVAVQARVPFLAAGFSAEIDGPPIPSPGCVVRLRSPANPAAPKPELSCPPENSPQTPDFLYRGNGERLSAVSSAVCFGRDLYLGQVFERGVGRVEGGCLSAPAAATPP